MHVSAALCAAALALALSACTGSQLPAGPLPSTPSSVDPGPARTPFPVQTPGPAPVLDEEQTRGLESTPWRVVSTSGRDLTIRFVAGGGCSRFTGVRVAEQRGSVEVWATVRTDQGQQACAAYLALGSTTVHLTAPLGSRTLLHAPVSPHWTIYIKDF